MRGRGAAEMDYDLSYWLEWGDTWIARFGDALSTGTWPVTAVIVALCALGILSKSVPHAVSCVIVTLLAVAQARQEQLGLALLMVSLACTIALLGFSATNGRRQTARVDVRLQRLQEETDAFLSALDNRARDIDRRLKSPPPSE